MITVNQNLNNNDLLALVKKVETEGKELLLKQKIREK
jgi:hypothetical protein